jgi:glycosyltransferase involved in cell wall biosynthesis
LFASGDSETKANLVSVTDKPTSTLECSENLKKYYLHLLISKCYNYSSKLDIIHSHFNLLSSFYSSLVQTPTIQSIHSPIKEEIKPLLLKFRANRYISFSLAQRKTFPELNWIANIYHGVDTKLFPFSPHPKDYFLFIGRITKEKGVHLAIKAAKAARIPLIIAGKAHPIDDYWHKEVQKYIDGNMIKYVGEANLKNKIELYKNAKAILFPTQYEEAFGLVMIEAMACGTPVIGWKKGSVPEVVSDKKTGFVVDNISDMVKAIKAINFISREETRKRAELYFSVKKMVSGYEKIYSRVTEECKFKKQNNKGKVK